MMSNSDWKSESAPDREHTSDSELCMSSAVLVACTKLQGALSQYAIAQCRLDGEHCLYSPLSEIDASLGQIRSARRECGELAERLFQMLPGTPLEADAIYNIMNAYRAQVGVDQMPCNSAHNDIYQKYRDLDIEAAQPECQCEQRLTLNILSWGKWPKRSSPPKRR